MIQVGYTKTVNDEEVDVIETSVETPDMVEVNEALASLQTTLSGRTDIVELFAQEYFGEDDEYGNRIYHKVGFQDLI
jgi:hypothetical protein